MINKEFRTSGTIGNDGKLYIYDQNGLGVFSRKHPDHKVLIEVKVIGKEASEAMCYYFREYILPEFRKALMEKGQYMTLEATEEYVCSLSPMLQEEKWEQNSKTWTTIPKKFEELDNYEGVHCIMNLKQIAALEFGFEIDDEQFINN